MYQYPWPNNQREFDAEFLRMKAEALLQSQEGIVPTSSITSTAIPGDLAVTTTGSGLGVSIAAGRAIVKGDVRSTQGTYFAYVPTAETVTMPAAHGTNPRVDAVVLKIDDADAGAGTSQWDVTYQQGTATAGASLSNLTGAPGQGGGPTLDNSALVLAYVLVPAAFAGPFVNATHILDQRNLALTKQAAQVVRTATQSITNSLATNIQWQTVNVDNNRQVDLTAANTRITCRVAGLYQINATCRFASNATGIRQVNIYKNGAETELQASTDGLGAAGKARLAIAGILKLSAGDYIELNVTQTSGGALNVEQEGTHLSLHRIA